MNDIPLLACCFEAVDTICGVVFGPGGFLFVGFYKEQKIPAFSHHCCFIGQLLELV